MGFATVYCDKCGSQILGAELEKGNAVSRGDKYFCPECVASLPPEAPGASPDRKGSTKFRKPSDSGRNTDIIRNLQAMGGSRGGTTRVSSPQPQPAGGLTPGAKAGIAIGGVVALAVIIFVVSQLGSGNGSSSGGGKGDTDKAKAAWEQAEGLRGKGKARDWLEAAQRAKRDAEGTEYSEKATALVREAQAALELEEKSDRVATDFRAMLAQARAADDPLTSEQAFREMLARARREAPALVDQIQAAFNEIVDMGLRKMLDRVDMTLASTPSGYRKVKEGLAEVSTKASGYGPAGKPVAEVAAKKLKEADEKFKAGADAACADLEKRVTQMLQDLKVEEAGRAIDMFLSDYAGTQVEAKAKALKDVVAAKRKDFDNAWIEPAEADWNKQLGDMKVTWSGKEMTFTCDGPDGPAVETETDNTRRLLFGKADSSWKDYEVEFEVMVEAHGGSIVLRSDSPNFHKLNFIPQNAKGEGLPLNQWFKLGMKVEGAALRIQVANNPPIDSATPSTNGTFMFIGYKGSKFHVRNVRVRRLR